MVVVIAEETGCDGGRWSLETPESSQMMNACGQIRAVENNMLNNL